MTTTETETCSRCGADVPPREIPRDLREASERNRRAAAAGEPAAGRDWVEILRRFPRLCRDCESEQAIDWAHDEALQIDNGREARHRERIDDANLPALLLGLTWDDVKVDDGNRAAIASARRWGAGEITGLVFSGSVGVGKTFIAGAAANQLLARRSLRWFSASKLVAQAKAGFKNPARDEVTELLINERMAVVIDDIDKINPTEFALDIFFQIIDSRIANGTPLLVTTNKSYDELEVQFGEPIASRLAKCTGHRLSGADRRVTHKKKEQA